MIALWMAYAVVVGVLVAVSARAAEEVMRAWRLPVRWVWVAALVAQLVVPVAGLRAAGWTGTNDRAGDPALAALVSGATVVEATASAAEGGDRAESRRSGWIIRAAEAAGPSRMAAFDGPLGVAWGAGTAGLVLLLAWTLGRSRADRRRWPVRRVLGETVRVAPSAGPAAVGVLRPEIVVPEWLLARSEGEVRLAIDHEREHVRAGDPGLLFIGSVVTALLPWNPAAWWIFTRLRLAVELDCDRRVISAGAERFAYGTLLLDLAEHRPAHRLMAATGLIGATSHLERRIRVMTHTVRFAPLRAAVFGVPAVVALLAACETALPTAAEIEAMDAGAVEREAVALRLLPGTADGAAARFIVDGKEVSREEAMAILPEEIVTIAVRGSGPVRTRVSGGAEREARIEATESVALSAGPAAGVIAPDGSLPAGSVIEIVTRAGASAGIVPVEAGDGMVTLGVRTAEGGAGPDSTRIVVMRRSEPGVETEVFVNGLRVDDAGGVIRVTGSDDEELVVETVRMRSAAPVPADPTAGPARVEGSVMLLDGAGGKPLIFLDGERVAESSTSTVLGRLGPDAIESIEVIKGPAAATLYGDEAADGVIRIVTKANAAQQR